MFENIFLEWAPIFLTGIWVIIFVTRQGEKVRKETLRLLFDLIVIAGGMWFFIEGVYRFAPAPLQLMAVKVILVSGALMHAHIAGKAIFKSVDWNSANWTPAHAARLVFYAVTPIAYAFGG